MNPFTCSTINNNPNALKEISGNIFAKFIAGGTDIIDLMKLYIEKPDKIVDINKLNLKRIEALPDGRLPVAPTIFWKRPSDR